jgi:hypothetical protein
MLREWIAKEYAADPAGVGGFARKSCRLVRVHRRQYHGRPQVVDAAVEVGGKKVDEGAVTRPRWKLVPDPVRVQFAALETTLDVLIATHGSTGAESDETSPFLLGRGVYVIDAAAWPVVERALTVVQEKWAAAADRWCTEDGYDEFHARLKEQLGEADYTAAKDLVPGRAALRRKYGLDFTPVHVRLVPEPGDAPADASALAGTVVEVLEAAVRRPRERAKAPWAALADQLVTSGADGTPTVRKRVRTDKTTGKTTVVARGVRGTSVVSAREAADVVTAHPMVEAELRDAAKAVARELPGTEAEATQIAKKLNADDIYAVNVGRILTTAIMTADDETLMIKAVAAARTPPAAAVTGT